MQRWLRDPVLRDPVLREPSGQTSLPLWVIFLPILVVVLGLVFVVVAVVARGTLDYAGVQNGAKTSFTEVTLNRLKSEVKKYQILFDETPHDLQVLVDGPTEAKAIAKWQTIKARKKWLVPILDEVPQDPWGNDFVYKVVREQFEIRSVGFDGQHGTSDVLVVGSSDPY